MSDNMKMAAGILAFLIFFIFGVVLLVLIGNNHFKTNVTVLTSSAKVTESD